MAKELTLSEKTDKAVGFIRKKSELKPQVAVVLGSGLGNLSGRMVEEARIPFDKIPHFPKSGVEGHAGELVLGKIGPKRVAVMNGRVHYYEGYTMQEVTFPIRVLRALGAKKLILTCAAGGMNPLHEKGDIVVLVDQINLTGDNPLIGPNDTELGPRFPDMASAYDPGLRAIARQVGQAARIPLHEGVYVCLAGPSFETPHEVHFLRLIGADAVGMSTVPEVIVARHMGVRVLGISGITNVHSTDPSRPRETTHKEVLEAGEIIAPRMIELVHGVLERL